MENKRDYSVSMVRANVVAVFIAIPLILVQFALFNALHGVQQMEPAWGTAILIGVILLGVPVHELIHGLTWMIAGRMPFSAIRFGFQWETLTPYAHLKEPIEVSAYRAGAFMPGFLLGVVPYSFSLLFADGNWFWFSVVHASAAGGDWLVLWLIRTVKAGLLVEDHPSRAGCFVIER